VNDVTAKSPLWARYAGGLCGALAGAGGGALLAALLDSRAAGAPELLWPSLGLIAPLALTVSALVWVLRLVFLGGEAVSVARFARYVRQREGEERATWVAVPPLASLAALLGLVAVSGITARVLGAEASGAAAYAVVPLAVLPVVLALVASVRLGGALLGPRLRGRGVSPLASVGIGLGLLGVGGGLLVAFGETGGGGAFGILGVLRREELDLRAPGLLLLVAACALFVPSPRRAAAGLALLLVGSLPLTLTAAAARGVTLSEDGALIIERRAPLGRIALRLMQRLTDRDGDGVSAAFAGGDCNDQDAGVSPRAVDLAGNGVDEDCQYGDAKPRSPNRLAPAAPALDAGGAELAADLNVLFVTIDTLRADLGYLGNPRNLSPNLDALAKESVVFERAYSLASYTGKSMGPLMIGKYSSELEGGFLHFNRYSKRETFVQERLSMAGVRTLSIQGYWYFFKDAGFERGFDVIDSSAAPKVAAIEGDQSSNSDELSDAAIRLLEAPEQQDRRFFMWMHYVDPHAEYAPHPEHDFGTKPRDRYDGEIAFVDGHLGRVLAALERAPFGKRTAVVVTSDHGEAFGEHGMIRHGFELWEELVRVPLIIKVPGVPARRVSARRSAIDVVPTLLELFKVPFVARADNDFLSGQSLLSDLTRKDGADPERPVLIDMARGPHNAERQALIDGDLKVTASEGRVLGVYDLAKDPAEKQDLSRDKQIAQPLRQKLGEVRASLRRVPMSAP
jgi:choline-sulfatase